MESKQMPFTGAYILAVLNATQTALEMAYRMDECQGGWMLGDSGLFVRLDVEPSDATYKLNGEAERGVSTGRFLVEDLRGDGGSCYRCYPVVFWDKDTGKPHIANNDFTEALLMVGWQLQIAVGNPTRGRALCVARAAKLLMLAELWKGGAEAWASSGLKNLAWTQCLEQWDGSINALRGCPTENQDEEQGASHDDDEIPF